LRQRGFPGRGIEGIAEPTSFSVVSNGKFPTYNFFFTRSFLSLKGSARAGRIPRLIRAETEILMENIKINP
jgi:hypothetical protein